MLYSLICLVQVCHVTNIWLVSGATVWIVGSSLVRGAFQRSLQRPDGPGLGLDQSGISIHWDYQNGMRLFHVIPIIEQRLRYYQPPELLIIHAGGNDIGTKSMVEITWEAKSIFNNLAYMLPNTTLVWSQILPRRSWRYLNITYVADKTRKRINSCLATYFIKNGGCYLHYPDLKHDSNFFLSDDVHLSVLGYDIMLNTLSGAVYSFIKQFTHVYPA